MGINITSYPIYNGAAHLENVYVNIRDIKTNKEQYDENYEYTFECMCNFTFNEKNIHTQLIELKTDNPYVTNLWEIAYTELKKYLNDNNITFTDSL